MLMGVDMQGFDNRSPGAAGAFDTPPESPVFSPSTSAPPRASSSSKPTPTPAPAPESESDEEPDEEAQAKADALKEKDLGNAAYKKRDFAAAETHFTKAWDLWPKDITFLTNLAGQSNDFYMDHLRAKPGHRSCLLRNW